MYRKKSVSSRVRMCAPSTSASVISTTLPYRAASRSNVRPEPAPITWMMAAHSAFLSMSVIEAFWTLRILPRIGSRAWKSELRASLAVPRALSPSTMKSSLRATTSVRQSASFAGSDEVSRAFLRREISFCLRALRRARISETTLSSSKVDWVLASRLDDVSIAPSSVSTTFATMARTADVPRTSFVCPSNCGSASRTVTTAVRPAMMSSFSIRSAPSFIEILSRRAFVSTAFRTVRSIPWSKPAR